jgi:hypothetical protein
MTMATLTNHSIFPSWRQAINLLESLDVATHLKRTRDDRRRTMYRVASCTERISRSERARVRGRSRPQTSNHVQPRPARDQNVPGSPSPFPSLYVSRGRAWREATKPH